MSTDKRTRLTEEELFSSTGDSLVSNEWLLPVNASDNPPSRLNLTLSFEQTEMQSNMQGVMVTDQPVDTMPSARIQLTSDGGNLIPLERDLIRDFQGNSYWDISFSPGRVWLEESDNGWSRAALPFQLSNIFENDTHHGVMMFLYRGDEVSPLYFQIVAETKSFLCPDNLLAWGYLHAQSQAVDAQAAQLAIKEFRSEQLHDHVLKPISDWRNPQTQPQFDDLETGFGSDTNLIYGLVIDDEIYNSDCQTVVGAFPYPRALKFGIWSATKTAFTSVACMRLAEKFGQDPRLERVADLLPEAKNNPDWQDITIGHCLNMATGIGTAAPQASPLNIFADYLLEETQASETALGRKSFEHYFDWFLTPSQHQKNTAAFACPNYPWGPDCIARYRDQDLYIAGAALDAWLKRQAGNHARIWDTVCAEVYTPAGILHPIKFHTIETDSAQEVPLSDAGLLLTMDNIAGLGKLILDGGKLGNEQILNPQILSEWFDPKTKKGLPTGIQTQDGEVHYYGGIWHVPYESFNGKKWWIPSMRGYGGQIIQTLPNGMTAFRFGFDSDATAERYDAAKLARLADSIKPFE